MRWEDKSKVRTPRGQSRWIPCWSQKTTQQLSCMKVPFPARLQALTSLRLERRPPAALWPLGTGHKVPPQPEITVAVAKDAGHLSGNAESPRQAVGEQSSSECASLCRETKTCPEAQSRHRSVKGPWFPGPGLAYLLCKHLSTKERGLRSQFSPTLHLAQPT